MPKSWRDRVSEYFILNLHELILFIDHDGLLSDEKIIHSLQQKGFEFIDAKDPMQLRYDYELIRQKKDSGVKHNNVVILCNPQEFDEQQVPFDIKRSSFVIKLSLSELLFPFLHEISIRQLEKQVYDTLILAVEDEGITSIINERQTNLFLLRALYRIHGNELQTDVDIFKMLLRLHYTRARVPSFLTIFLDDYVHKKNESAEWQLRKMLEEPQVFWSYVQEIWEAHLLGKVRYSLVGPSKLPFSHSDIVVYLDNAFKEGFLEPVRISHDKIQGTFPKSLLDAGTTQGTKEEINTERLTELLELLPSRIPLKNANCNDWLKFQPQYAQLGFLSATLKLDPIVTEKLHDFISLCSASFIQWLREHFSALPFEQPSPPVLVSQIIGFLNKQRLKFSKKIALIVLDGMSYSQWLSIRASIEVTMPSVTYEESSCFAMVPTLTSVSRQSIFAGKLPKYFESTINTTSSEEKLWNAAWKNENPYCINNQISFMKEDGRGDPSQILSNLPYSNIYAGIVINAVDEIMHGTTLGEHGMHESIALWMKNGYLENLIKGLHLKGYSVWITSDHGNTEAKGVGRIQQGALSEIKGQRVRIYSSKALRDSTAREYKEISSCWDSSTLPSNYYPLIANERGAFVTKNDIIVSHGGVSLEEVVVPFIKVIEGKNE